MRILFVGVAPWCNTGYSKPYRWLVPGLHELGHEIGIATFFGYNGSIMRTQVGGAPVTLFPPARTKWCDDIVEHHANAFRASVVISLCDVWMLEKWGQKPMRWCPWFPIDTHPVSIEILNALQGCHTPLVYTRWAQQELAESGYPNARYMPFGVDTGVYAPKGQAEARQAMGMPDGFVAGMVASNSSSPSRKSHPEVLRAWKRWREGGGDGHLYLHTSIAPHTANGLDMVKLLDTLQLDWSTLSDEDEARHGRASVLFPDQHAYWSGAYNDGRLADIINSFDVLLSPSMAEGFGIPIVEAQACGVPVVTLDVTSMPELTWAGMCLEPVQMAWHDQGGWRGVAPVGGIRDAIEWARGLRDDEQLRQDLARTARAHAKLYDAEIVLEDFWRPFLEGMV